MAHVIYTHTGVSTPFESTRLHDSIATACYSVRLAEGIARDIAVHVCKSIETWLSTKSEVTSQDIRRKAGELLSLHCPEAGYLYQNQHTIL